MPPPSLPPRPIPLTSYSPIRRASGDPSRPNTKTKNRERITTHKGSRATSETEDKELVTFRTMEIVSSREPSKRVCEVGMFIRKALGLSLPAALFAVSEVPPCVFTWWLRLIDLFCPVACLVFPSPTLYYPVSRSLGLVASSLSSLYPTQAGFERVRNDLEISIKQEEIWKQQTDRQEDQNASITNHDEHHLNRCLPHPKREKGGHRFFSPTLDFSPIPIPIPAVFFSLAKYQRTIPAPLENPITPRKETSMCYTTIPLHTCSHAGPRIIHGEPCPRARPNLPRNTSDFPVPSASEAPSRNPSISSFASTTSSLSSSSSMVSHPPTERYRPCAYAIDYGVQNVPGLCARCLRAGSAEVSVKSMLESVQSAAAGAALTRNADGDEVKALEGELSKGAALSADVPDLGFLGSLGADDGGQTGLVGREVLGAFQASWVAYQRELKGGD